MGYGKPEISVKGNQTVGLLLRDLCWGEAQFTRLFHCNGNRGLEYFTFLLLCSSAKVLVNISFVSCECMKY